MTADIVKSPNRSVLGADHDNRICVHSQSKIIPRSGNLARVPGKQPPSPPNPFEIEPMDFLVKMKLARQRPARTASGQERFDTGRRPAAGAILRCGPNAASVARMDSVLHVREVRIL